MMAERGRFMKKWLLKQLYDHPNGINWASLLYQHGSVDLLTRSANKPTNDINSKLFAEALIDVVGKAQIVHLHENNEDPKTAYQSDLLKNFKHATKVLKPSDVVSMFQYALQSSESYSKSNGGKDEAEIYQNLVLQIQSWYTELEERLSFWYKKQTRVQLFYIGVAIALIVNVDSIQLFTYLNQSSVSRESLLVYYQDNMVQLEELTEKINNPELRNQYSNTADSILVKINSLSTENNIPVGLTYNVFCATPDRTPWAFYLLKILGVLISGFAASFGAPFWFDLFKKLNPSPAKLPKS